MFKTKKRYVQKFRKAWLTYADFKDWLEEVEIDETKIRCKVCDSIMIAKLKGIVDHSNTMRHQRNFASYYNSSEIQEELNKTDKDDAESFVKTRHADKLLQLKSKDWKGVCLVCLRKNRKILKSIFQNDSDNIMIFDKISECSVFQINFDINIPLNICLDCYHDLNAAYRFRKYCEKSYNTLKNIICNTNITSDDVEDFVEILDDCDSNYKNVRIQKNIFEPLKIANTTITLKKNQKDLFVEDEQGDEYDDDDASIVGTFIDNNDFYTTEENYTSEYDNESVEQDNFEIIIEKTATKKEKGKTNERTLICDMCGNSYKDQYSLNIHVKRHLNIRSYECEICKKGFFLESELRRHMRTHTGEKPYKCQYCDKKFADFSARKRHERTHTGERPYVCTVCGKAFMYPKSLKVHLRTHS